jgi:hypothetical protein
MAKNIFYCRCRDCRRMKRKGYILGDTLQRHLRGGFQTNPERKWSDAIKISEYVPYPRWQSGKRHRRNREIEENE